MACWQTARIFGEEPAGKEDGVSDGIKVDRTGNLYITGPGGIWVWHAKGRHVGTILMPEQTANLAWGGKDYLRYSSPQLLRLISWKAVYEAG
jgi:sugar lactone lactonase YvrE